MASILFRLLSFQLLKFVNEPEWIHVGQMVRILGGIRRMNLTNGFNYLLQPFVEIAGQERKGES
jgi:hypothetical protein